MFEQDGTLNVTYSLYRVLELRPQCADDDITRAYRKLALKYHPDKSTGCPEKFNEIKTAHDILKDPIKRKFYDRFGDSGMKFISSSDGAQMVKIDTSTFIGRTILRILTRPTLLFPYFFAIAFINFCLIIFFYLLDKKLYFNGFKTVPWFAIFSLLWIYLLGLLSALGLFAYWNIINFKNVIEENFGFEEFSKIPTPRRKFLSIVNALYGIFIIVSLIIFILLCIYSSSLMAIYFDENGKLANGMTWARLYSPSIWFENFISIVLFIFNLVLIIRFNNPKRLWQERLLSILGFAILVVSTISYNHFIIQFFDTSEKFSLISAYFFLYILLPLLFFLNHYQTKWRADDLTESLLEKLGEDARNKINDSVQETIKLRKRFNYFSIGIIFINMLLLNLHYAGYWPKSWSMTYLPFLICVYSSMFVFGAILPVIVVLMNNAIPQNSFDSFDSASPEEEGITVIEIPFKLYNYGFGLAAFQRRIKS